MPLNGYSSLCEERQRIIVSRDSGTRELSIMIPVM